MKPPIKARARALPSRSRQGRAGPGPGIQTPQGGMTLHTADGARKYLTAGEREAFLRAAEQMDRQAR
ncbi:MAG: site-specific integrase, partial [Acetobacteraceae bacterium]